MEFALVEEQMQEIDALIEQGRTSLNWNSTGIYAIIYVILFDTTVEHLFLCLVSVSILVMFKHLERDYVVILLCFLMMYFLVNLAC